MWNRAKNWREMIMFIRKHRKEHRASFQILTTSSEVIIVEKETREQIRINEIL